MEQNRVKLNTHLYKIAMILEKIQQPMSRHMNIQIANGAHAPKCLTNCRHICESYGSLTCSGMIVFFFAFFIGETCEHWLDIFAMLQITHCMLHIW